MRDDHFCIPDDGSKGRGIPKPYTLNPETLNPETHESKTGGVQDCRSDAVSGKSTPVAPLGFHVGALIIRMGLRGPEY